MFWSYILTFLKNLDKRCSIFFSKSRTPSNRTHYVYGLLLNDALDAPELLAHVQFKVTSHET